MQIRIIDMNAKNVLLSSVFGVVLAWTAVLHGQGQVTALQGWSGGQNYDWGATTGFTFGWQFQVNQDIQVNSLGVDDLGAAADSHEVGIWNDAGILLAAATVNFPGQSPNAFVWVGLGTPLDLSAGTYRIGAFFAGPATDIFVYTATSVTMAPAITYLNSACSDDTAFSFPNNTGWYSDAFFGPNFQYTTVPEPSVLALLGLGGLAMASWRRNRGNRK
jgi:hypothetical protein